MRAIGWAWCLAIVVGCHGDDHPSAAGSTGTDESSSGSASTGTSSGTSSDDGVVDDSSTTGAPHEVPGDGPFGGGARLQPVVERSGEAMRLLHWYDSELGIECSLARDASGELRCLPIAVPDVAIEFAEPSCEDGVVQAAACADVPGWLRADAPGAAECDAGTRQLSYRRGAPQAAPAVLWEWSSFSGQCVSAGEVVGDHYGIDRADDDMFLAAQLVDEPGDGGLMIRAAVFDDGSYERMQLLDAATSRPCSPHLVLVDEAAVEECRVDDIGAVGRVFATADCASDALVVVSDDGSCEPPALASDGTTWWQVGDVFVGDAYTVVDDSCTLFVATGTEVLRERGAEAPAPDFAPVIRAALPIGERLQPWGVVIDGAPLQLTHMQSDATWWDATLAHACEPVELAEGGRICAHAITYPQNETLWGDPECVATPLVRRHEAEPPPIVVSVVDDGCRTVADHARAVVGEWTDPIYELDPRTAICALADEPEDIGHLQLGNTVQLADLPALTIETLVP